MQTTTLPLSKLAPNKGQVEGLPKNPRLIKDAKFRALCKSLRDDPEMMQLREIIAYDRGDGSPYVIVGGNMRYHALREIGEKQAPVKLLPPGTPAAKLRAYAVKDNSSYGDWDFDLLANEWDLAEITDWGVDIPNVDAPPKVKTEEVEEDGFDPGKVRAAETRPGDLYALGPHRLLCGDATDPAAMAHLCDGAAVDLLLTDPPYNVDYSEKDGYMKERGKANMSRQTSDIENDRMTEPQYVEFLTAALSNAAGCIKPGGSFYVWHASMHSDSNIAAVRAAGLEWKQTLVWNKNRLVLGRQDYQWKHELCLYGWKPGAAHYFIDWRGEVTTWLGEVDVDAMSKAELKELYLKIVNSGLVPTTVIDENKPQRSADHPTMKPLKLMGRCIRNSTRTGETVLDPFGGSGSTLLAAEQLGRRCLTMELDPVYCDVIVRRWEEYTGGKAQRLDPR